ncbi:MAG: NifU family protein [bacterium]|nr:NifU family protein [bacterium]
MTGISADVRRKLEQALDRIRPGLLRDGGNVELLAVATDGTVQLELQGACASCPAQSATVRFALEPALREAAPEVSCVVPVPGDPTPPRR